MSKVYDCPTCGGKAKVKERDGETTYQAIKNDEMVKKIEQLKKAMQKFKEKSEALEKQLEEIQNSN
ncbi:hypothetical protein [Joostella sp. CR20]|uniref:hypothetical protein n=1 Tax=Joostella sp. CR20 TaxID=2804312 RepID=UPI00313D64F1